MLTYSADSYQMFGELYHYPAAKYRPGTMLDVYEWDALRTPAGTDPAGTADVQRDRQHERKTGRHHRNDFRRAARNSAVPTVSWTTEA